LVRKINSPGSFFSSLRSAEGWRKEKKDEEKEKHFSPEIFRPPSPPRKKILFIFFDGDNNSTATNMLQTFGIARV
jgi:hypothetical protein